MPKTAADEWFESYLAERGYEPGRHEPDLSDHGVSTRPDFLARHGDATVACEVKAFGRSSRLAKRLSSQGYVAASDKEVFGPIRNQVGAAAQTLRPLAGKGIPLVVVLANPEGAPVDLGVEHVVAALYGNPHWAIPLDASGEATVGPGRLELGRDGKLRSDHQYVSAVALLRRRTAAQDEAERIAARASAAIPDRPGDPIARRKRMAAAFEALEGRGLPEGEYFWVDVIETISETAQALPCDWFDGPRDRRWRFDRDGDLRLVRAP